MALRPPSALRDYQLTGIGRMIANAHVGQAALLKPGLGKTVIAQTAVTRLRPKRTLVAGPAQVVESKVWSQEAMEWEHLCGLRIVELTGTPDQRAVKLMLDADIFVVSYDNLIWLTDEVERDFFDAAVYDELSKMKHPGTQRFKRMRAWAKNIPIKFGLTGSPLGNHWADLWGEMFTVTGPRALGPTKEQYLDTYFKQVAMGDGVPRWEIRQDGSADIIRQRIKPYAFSLNARLAAQQLPEVITDPVRLEVPKKCRDLELKLRRELEVELDSGKTLMALTNSKLAMAIRQFASGAVYIGEAGDTSQWEEVHDVKLRYVKDLVDELQGEPLLVFTWFKHEASRLKKLFPDAELLDGSPEMIARWNAKKIPRAHRPPPGLGPRTQPPARRVEHLLVHAAVVPRTLRPGQRSRGSHRAEGQVRDSLHPADRRHRPARLERADAQG
jgi:SNF2 family DNA or RNA helicase